MNEQHSLLDQEWRNARLWVHEFEEEMPERQGQLKVREEELNEKSAPCENLVSELEEQERLVLSLRDQVSVERTGLRVAVDRELEIERRTLQQTRTVLDEASPGVGGGSRKTPPRVYRTGTCTRDPS